MPHPTESTVGSSGVGGAAGGSTGAPGGAGGMSGSGTTSPGEGAYPYDPNVRFVWDETPVPEGPCLPGTYEGTFTCALEFIPGLEGFPLTGPVRFTLEQSENGEFLEVTDGLLEGEVGEIRFTANLEGALDCSSNAFEADAVDGTYTDDFLTFGVFDGTLDASLERSSQLLNGTWSLTAAGYPPCVGPWSAHRAAGGS
jgi:hypothetical protein